MVSEEIEFIEFDAWILELQSVEILTQAEQLLKTLEGKNGN